MCIYTCYVIVLCRCTFVLFYIAAWLYTYNTPKEVYSVDLYCSLQLYACLPYCLTHIIRSCCSFVQCFCVFLQFLHPFGYSNDVEGGGVGGGGVVNNAGDRSRFVSLCLYLCCLFCVVCVCFITYMHT